MAIVWKQQPCTGFSPALLWKDRLGANLRLWKGVPERTKSNSVRQNLDHTRHRNRLLVDQRRWVNYFHSRIPSPCVNLPTLFCWGPKSLPSCCCCHRREADVADRRPRMNIAKILIVSTPPSLEPPEIQRLYVRRRVSLLTKLRLCGYGFSWSSIVFA